MTENKELLVSKGKCQIFLTEDGELIITNCKNIRLTTNELKNVQIITNYLKKVVD